MINIEQHTSQAVALLKELIAIPSYTSEEGEASDFLYNYLCDRIERECVGVDVERLYNNLLLSTPKREGLPTLMLTAHLDTVPPCEGYSFEPHTPQERDGAIYGLGANDDGASLVAMVEAFLYLAKRDDVKLNILLALCAEEERSGDGGMRAVVAKLSQEALPDMAIVGEPTGMRAAIAERGLLVIDGCAEGESAHAAHSTGVNALYVALDDVAALRCFELPKISPTMGRTKITVTCFKAGTQHNIVPDKAHFTIDCRPTDCYTNEEILQILQSQTKSRLTARNLKNRASATPTDSVLMGAIERCGIATYISPTTSDWVCLGSIPAVKMGAGDSQRSHRADEYVLISELADAIQGYIKFIENI